ncbi:MAG TPA: immunoglobulin domain-containing protein [Opitutaceae bacterium]
MKSNPLYGLPRQILIAACCAISALLPQRIQAQALQNNPWTTLAGTPGARGFSPGTGSSVRFGLLTCAAADASGNLYVADETNHVVWKVTPAGVASVFETLTGSAPGQSGVAVALAVGASGDVYMESNGFQVASPDGTLSTITKITGPGPGYSDGPPNIATFSGGTGLAVDAAGDLFFPDGPNSTIREYSTSNLVSTIAGLAQQFGHLDGTGTAARFDDPEGMAIDSSGNLYVCDSDAVRKVTQGGVVTTVAGQGGVIGYADGTGSAAKFYDTHGIAIDSGGNLYVTVADNTVRMITPAGVVSTIGGMSNMTGSTNAVGANALFSGPNGIAVDAAGDLYVVDAGNSVIRKLYNSPPAAPAITSQPSSLSVAVGASAIFSVTATAVPAATYQWLFNGNYLAGATGPSLTVSNVQAYNLGTYTVAVSNGSGSVTSSAVTLSSPGVSPAPAPAVAATLVNISTRAQVSTGAETEIVGFVVTGPPGSTEQLLIRGVGQTLVPLGILNSLAQPVLTLFDVSGGQLATNTDYGTSSDKAQIVSAAASSGAFPLLASITGEPTWDSALLVTLSPGTYTAQVSPHDGNPGIALAELYAVGTNTAKLTNISTRAFVGTGQQVAIAGISVGGNEPTTVLVRAIGPTLSQFSVSGGLQSPVLTVVDNTGNTVGTNQGWANNSNASQIAAAALASGAFAIPAASADSALLLTLQPGNYTATVSGAGGSTGIALVEAYQVP